METFPVLIISCMLLITCWMNKFFSFVMPAWSVSGCEEAVLILNCPCTVQVELDRLSSLVQRLGPMKSQLLAPRRTRDPGSDALPSRAQAGSLKERENRWRAVRISMWVLTPAFSWILIETYGFKYGTCLGRHTRIGKIFEHYFPKKTKLKALVQTQFGCKCNPSYFVY